MTRLKIPFAAALLGASLLFTGCVSSTQTGSENSEVAEGEQTSEDGDEVCETNRPTGSNIPREVCYEKEDADARREEDQKAIRDSGRYGCSGGSCGGGGG